MPPTDKTYCDQDDCKFLIDGKCTATGRRIIGGYCVADTTYVFVTVEEGEESERLDS